LLKLLQIYAKMTFVVATNGYKYASYIVQTVALAALCLASSVIFCPKRDHKLLFANKTIYLHKSQ
jgi:hypothetical protein